MLVECYHNINAYGKNIAEVSANLLLPTPNSKNIDEILEAGTTLVDLCRSFSKVYKCKVSIDSMDCWKFPEIILDDKAYVKIEHHKK
jgi:hypothetical protein